MQARYTSKTKKVNPSWNTLVSLEPALDALEREIWSFRDNREGPEFNADYQTSYTFKPRLVDLIGFHSRIPDQVLRSTAAYDVAYDHLYGMLTDDCFSNCGLGHRKRPYLIDPILPAHEVHLVAGHPEPVNNSWPGRNRFGNWIPRSTARFMLGWVRTWMKGQPILGFETRPASFAYIGLNCLEVHVEELLTAEGVDIPWTVVYGDRIPAERLFKAAPDADALIVEDFQLIVGERRLNNYSAVRRALLRYGTLCEQANKTIIGLVPATTQRFGGRTRVKGCGAWAAAVETICVLDPIGHGDFESPLRRLGIYTLGKPEQFVVSLDNPAEAIHLQPETRRIRRPRHVQPVTCVNSPMPPQTPNQGQGD